MYEEVAPRRKGSFWAVFLIVVIGFTLFSLPDWLETFVSPFDFPYFTVIYEFTVFVIMGILIFLFIRRYSVDCKYTVMGPVLTVKEKTGAREIMVFQTTLTADSVLLPMKEGEKFLQENGQTMRFVTYGVSDKNSAYLLTFPSVNGISAMIFQPSDKFVEILQQIVLDKRREM